MYFYIYYLTSSELRRNSDKLIIIYPVEYSMYIYFNTERELCQGMEYIYGVFCYYYIQCHTIYMYTYM